MDFVADGGFLLTINIGFRKFWWISWISIFRPTEMEVHFTVAQHFKHLKKQEIVF